MDLCGYNLKEKKVKEFVTCLENPKWGINANEKTVDEVFQRAIDIQETFSQVEKGLPFESLFQKTQLDLKKSVELLMDSILKNQHLNEHLTLYAINKYITLHSKTDFTQILDNILGEIQLRECLFKLNEELADVDLDLFRINNFLCEMLIDPNSNLIMYNALNNQNLIVLNAAKHCSQLAAQFLIGEMIRCLESQSDLRLWFKLLKFENLEIVIDLCAKYSNFLESVLKFFDKFANEIESTYDEDLNVKYSHVNLDFEEFVNAFQLFLDDKQIGDKIAEYLKGKILPDKNFCFWVDVKSCL